MPYVDSIGMPAGYTNNSPYGPLQAEGMSPQEAGALLRERLLRRQQRLSETSMQFADNAHQLNR